MSAAKPSSRMSRDLCAKVNLLRTPSSLMVGRIGASMLMLGSAPIIARTIGPDGRGVTAAAVAVIALLPVFLGAGMPWAVRRQGAIADDPKSVARTARFICAFLSVPALLTVVAVDQLLFSEQNAGVRLTIALGVMSAPLIVHRNNLISLFVVEYKYLQIFLATVVQPAVYFVGVCALALAGRLDVVGVLAAYNLGTLATVLTASYGARIGLRGIRGSARSLVRESIRSAGAQIADASSQRLDQVLLMPLVGASTLGHYSVAVNYGTAPTPVGQAIAASYFPQIARKYDVRTVLLSVRGSGCVAAVISIVGVFAAPFLVPFIFGSEFAPSVIPAQILSIGAGLLVVSACASSALFASGRGLAVTVSQFLGLAAGIGAMYLLAPIWGATGAACASLIGYAVSFIAMLVPLRIGPLALIGSPADAKAVIAAVVTRENGG